MVVFAARQLDELNMHRKQLQRRLTQAVLAELGDAPDAFVVVAGPEEEGWHRGVVGIVASRVKDELHRPAAVVSIQGDRAVGSVRSIPAVHAVRALDGRSTRELRLKVSVDGVGAPLSRACCASSSRSTASSGFSIAASRAGPEGLTAKGPSSEGRRGTNDSAIRSLLPWLKPRRRIGKSSRFRRAKALAARLEMAAVR